MTPIGTRGVVVGMDVVELLETVTLETTTPIGVGGVVVGTSVVELMRVVTLVGVGMNVILGDGVVVVMFTGGKGVGVVGTKMVLLEETEVDEFTGALHAADMLATASVPHRHSRTDSQAHSSPGLSTSQMAARVLSVHPTLRGSKGQAHGKNSSEPVSQRQLTHGTRGAVGHVLLGEGVGVGVGVGVAIIGGGMVVVFGAALVLVLHAADMLATACTPHRHSWTISQTHSFPGLSTSQMAARVLSVHPTPRGSRGQAHGKNSSEPVSQRQLTHGDRGAVGHVLLGEGVGVGVGVAMIGGGMVVVFGAALVVLHAADMLATAWRPQVHSLMEEQEHSSPGLSTSQTGSLELRVHPTPDGFSGQEHGRNSSDPEAQMHFTHGTCGAVGHVLLGGGVGVGVGVAMIGGGMVVEFGAALVMLHAADMLATACTPHRHSWMESQAHSSPGLLESQMAARALRVHPTPRGSRGQAHGKKSSEPVSQRQLTHGTRGAVGHVLLGEGVGVGVGVGVAMIGGGMVVVFGAALVVLHAADMLATAWRPQVHSLMEEQEHSSPGLSTSQIGSLEPGVHPTPDGFNGQEHGLSGSVPEAHIHFTHGTWGAVGHVLFCVGVVGGGVCTTVVDVVFGAALHAADMLAMAWRPQVHCLMEEQGHSSPGLSTSQTGSLEPRVHPTPDGFNGQAHGSNSSVPRAHMHFTHGT
ncbi:hypothetical protein GP486_005899 [Trichoglossum hirsutum]|uniref:Uncharacterized protein n=1 Tax=Trichoglossum hirsutum TaxID=265104 RepID=A0A9P8RLE6_9PEZI|nr:hypothetical protein GP486_005899 [Trichoglossum hirsutum]